MARQHREDGDGTDAVQGGTITEAVRGRHALPVYGEPSGRQLQSR
jgi:hypothetical protein